MRFLKKLALRESIKRAIYSSFFCLLLSPTFGQRNTPFVAGWSEDLSLYNHTSISSVSGSKTDLPTSIDLSPFCPTPKTQGVSGACVGWAAGYASMTIQYAIEKNWSQEQLNQNSFSGLFPYHFTKKDDCLSGTTLVEMGKFLSNNGNCSSTLYDEPFENCDRLPSEDLVNQALAHTILDYNALFRSDADNREKINKIRLSLSDSIPVVAGFNVYSSFMNLQSSIWRPNSDLDELMGGHALTVIAYDDLRRKFKIMNCWGTNWGDGGFAWLSYDDFANHCVVAMQYIVPDLISDTIIQRDITTTIKGEISIRTPYWPNQYADYPEFRNLGLKYLSNGTFGFTKNNWRIGDQYQILASNLPSKTYIYVFSMDDTGLNIHFPRRYKYSQDILGSGESPLRPRGGNVIIPSEDIALERRTNSKDYIFVLISSTSIPDFSQRLSMFEELSLVTLDKTQVFRQIFADLLSDPEDIHYQASSTVNISAELTIHKNIIPLTFVIEN